ncbi:6-phosphogluconate dehydrogenase (decarboxylating) [Candidatus Gottesmanbacteria bacterium RIFCSPLOWO2_01_FULL_39_12b]|uniref:6-phosphogluconate dehydrogenase (Decarboxylating) n=1 Tax=Candidatus Gottesmanbacteria bacterium RIFCSPLOWO2_01_FULL_39_12b TaxID=1798388 RepID=A0A1F6ASM9_9BACT|nr:MAG: 6-phosphogluconate dehydrogenase (decarboxylating) [Candidatus Gottesmanbacteria bacterium RIFCSPLOWO2_01_FULL_39_12b]
MRPAKGGTRSPDKLRDDRSIGKLTPCYNLNHLVNNLAPPRIIWLMVEHGKPVDEVIRELIKAGVTKGDIIIDGGNSFYKDSVKRHKFLKEKGINFLDMGTSGGLEGARNGACLMIGGEKNIYEKLVPLFQKLIGTKGGYAYFGPAGAGHFVKMVHNGVEYGMLQAIGEGFELLAKGPYDLNFHLISKNWNSGSVVRGWLMELLERALQKDPKLKSFSGIIGGGSTGEWTVETAKELEVKVPVIKESLDARKKSLDKPSFSGKVVAALRYQFGGHKV